MKIHHLNCGTMRPRVPSSLIGHSHLVCHCLAIETPHGLVLVDTGLGLQDIENPIQRLGRPFTHFTRPRLDPEDTAEPSD